jgi:hypothetical protein
VCLSCWQCCVLLCLFGACLLFWGAVRTSAGAFLCGALFASLFGWLGGTECPPIVRCSTLRVTAHHSTCLCVRLWALSGMGCGPCCLAVACCICVMHLLDASAGCFCLMHLLAASAWRLCYTGAQYMPVVLPGDCTAVHPNAPCLQPSCSCCYS